MGNYIFSLFDKLFQSSYKMVILGWENAGKTTILYQLHLKQLIQTCPTVGVNIEEVKYKNLKLQTWDIGGQKNFRENWSLYLKSTDVIIFVIDSSDLNNKILNQNELSNLFQHKDLDNTIFLIFANKQDLNNSLKKEDIIKEYNLHEIGLKQWHIQECSAKENKGLKEGFDWIYKQLSSRK